MIIYLFKIVLLLHLTMVESETLPLKLTPKNPRSVLGRNKLHYSDYGLNSQVIKIIPPPQAYCYCGKKYSNSISDKLNPTKKAEIERFVVYLYVKRVNNKRESYIYLPNAEKQKLMPDFAKSEGDVLVKNSNTDNEDIDDLAEFNERPWSYPSNNDYNIFQETTPLLNPNQDETRHLEDSWHFVDPKIQKAYKSKFSRTINKRNILQSILDDSDEALEDGSRNGIRSKLPWLKLNKNSYSYQEEEINLLNPGEHTIEDYSDDYDFSEDDAKYLRPNKRRGVISLNPIKPISAENSWKNIIETKQLNPLVHSTSGHSSTKPQSWHKIKQAQRPLDNNQALKPRIPIQTSLYEEPWWHSVESEPAIGPKNVKTYWKRHKGTKNFPSKPPRHGPLRPLKPTPWSPKNQNLDFNHEKNHHGLKPLKPIQSPKNLPLQPPIETDHGDQNNMNSLRPKYVNELRPLGFDANEYDEFPSLASVDEEDRNNIKPWSLSLEEELIEPKNYELDKSNIFETLYRQKQSDWSPQKPTITPNKKHFKSLGSQEYLPKSKSHQDRWNLRVISKLKNNIRNTSAIPQAPQLGPNISPIYTPLYKNSLKKWKPITRSIQPLIPKKSIRYGPRPGTNSTPTNLPTDADSPKFRIIGGTAAVGSGGSLNNKGKRDAGFGQLM